MIAIKPYLLFFVVCGRTSVLRQYNFSCYNNVKLLFFFLNVNSPPESVLII